MSQDECKLPKSPYIGLIPYSEEDWALFFGREAEIEIITANLMGSPLTLLYGGSGVGKSSVLRAGVAHQIRQIEKRNLKKHGKPKFVVVVFNAWRDDPLAGLLDQTRLSVTSALEETIHRTKQPQAAFSETLQKWAELAGGKLLIILDQFEEYFLYHAKEDGPGTFAVEFPRAVNRSDLRVNFMISMREDALARLDKFKGRILNLFANRLQVQHLNLEAAREAILEPVNYFNRKLAPQNVRVHIQPELVDTVLKQLSSPIAIESGGLGQIRSIESSSPEETQIETPYLQLVMTRLWEQMGSKKSSDDGCDFVMSEEELNIHLGGAANIVRTHLDSVMTSLNESEQNTAARVFPYLVTRSGTKIAYPVFDLVGELGLDETELRSVLQQLTQGNTRVLRPVGPAPGQSLEEHNERYEIFHDVLAQAILSWIRRRSNREAAHESQKEVQSWEATRLHISDFGEVSEKPGITNNYLDLFGRDLDAVVDIGEPPLILIGMVKGSTEPTAFFQQFSGHNILGSHRKFSSYHISLLDDFDMVGRAFKGRFAADIPLPSRFEITAHAVGVQLTTLGIPTIYYGTEQAFDGSHRYGDYTDPGNEDRYIRESMFGGSFGAFRTAGCHFFNPGHPTYLRIAAIARIRNRKDKIGLTLRRGRQYLRETSFLGFPFNLPKPGEIVAWSRILQFQEVLVVLNTHGTESRGAAITVDASLHPPGSGMTFLYRGDWSDKEIREPPENQSVPVIELQGGRASVRVDLPPAGMAILA